MPVTCEATVMSIKEHGTSKNPVMKNLRYGVDYDKTDKISNFNRHYAEHSGYFLTTNWLNEIDKTKATVYYDPNTGNPLFKAPIGRTFEEFLAESKAHGWPSFRDAEVNWNFVRCMKV